MRGGTRIKEGRLGANRGSIGKGAADTGCVRGSEDEEAPTTFETDGGNRLLQTGTPPQERDTPS